MTDEEKKQQIVFDVLNAIKTKLKDNKSFKDVKNLNLRILSEKIHLFAIKKALKDTTDNSCSIEMLFHKAGILSFLYDVNEILRKDANYDFASNLKVSTKGRKKIRKMSSSELEKKAIQYDVALLSIYQEKVDEIMKSEIKIFDEKGKEIEIFDEKNNKIKNSIDKLDAIDYEFINLSLDDKKEILKLLNEDNHSKILKSYPSWNKSKLEDIKTISIWQSLTTEEKAINDFLDKDKKDKDFKYFEDKVMKKYSGNLDFNEFLMKFGEVWKLNKENYVKRLFDNKRFDNADKRFIRKNNSDRTGFTDNDKEQHENLLASMHRVYITGVDKKGNLTKWGENDGKLLALLSKELVQHTKRVEIFLKDNKTNTIYTITHDDVCGKKAKITKRKYPQIWKEACDLLSGNGLFHSELKKKINESKTVGEAVFNVRRVFENPKLKLTKKCKNDFNRVLNEVLKDVKKENQQ